jgi:hypothetical protein
LLKHPIPRPLADAYFTASIIGISPRCCMRSLIDATVLRLKTGHCAPR